MVASQGIIQWGRDQAVFGCPEWIRLEVSIPNRAIVVSLQDPMPTWRIVEPGNIVLRLGRCDDAFAFGKARSIPVAVEPSQNTLELIRRVITRISYKKMWLGHPGIQKSGQHLE